jgi:endonuclease G, mitochondrial
LFLFVQCQKTDDNNMSQQPDNIHLTLGNPSNATENDSSLNNFLMIKHQYALSYNNVKGTANWVSWHLNSTWLGSAARCDCFTTDNTLPSTFTRITTSDYTNTGFDRGHLCPSADRTANDADNAATFLMTNIMPQAPNLNRQPWARLEDYCRKLIEEGNEMYIITGGYGTGGTGSKGGVDSAIAGGNVHVPSYYWKVIVVLPNGDDDLNRIDASTRVITVAMPNNQNVSTQKWDYYRTSVDEIEASTGYDFLSKIPASLQSILEQRIDDEIIP